MSFLGKLHEIFLYGIIATIITVFIKKVAINTLIASSINPSGWVGYFQAYMGWSMILFIPIAIICAYSTKYTDDGEGLYFYSNNILIIIFAHIAEELLGLFLTPFWFLRDLFTKRFDFWKVVDYATYLIELVTIIIFLVYL